MQLIPCLTKLDLPNANPDAILPSLKKSFGFEENEVIWTSAKTGDGVADVLQSVVDLFPPPKLSSLFGSSFEARIVDGWHNMHKGVVCLVSVTQVSLKFSCSS